MFLSGERRLIHGVTPFTQSISPALKHPIPMFATPNCAFHRLWRAAIFCLTAGWLALAPDARAGLTFQIHLARFNANGTNYYYTIDGGGMTTNSNPSNPPFGDYFLVSPGYPGAHGTEATFHYDSTNGFSGSSGSSGFYGDFASMMNGLTNGNWTLFITNLAGNSVSTYSFAISAPTLTSNATPNVFVTFPTNGATNITNMPTFTWVGGSTSYDGEDIKLDSANDNSFHHEVLTAVSVTSWQFPGVTVPPGTYNFSIDYNVTSNSLMVASTPTNGLHQAISSWVSTAMLDTSFQSQFTVPLPASTNSSFQGHALVLHYTWDGSFSDAGSASLDVSGNGNNSSYSAGGGPNGGVTLTNSAVEGGQAVHFHDPDGGSLGALGVLTPSSVLDALAGSFTVSCWIRTTNHFGNDTDFAFSGAGIVAADKSGLANDVVPIALTGSKIAFNTGGSSDQTIHSTNSVTNGIYHLVTVTRDLATGNKAIYIDGVLDTTGPGTTNLLNDPQMVCFGAQINAATANLGAADFHNGYDGDMDDLQIYSGVLLPAEVAFLFQNPGLPAPNLSGNGLVAHYAFENTNNIGQDTSGNGFDLNLNGDDGVTPTTDAKAGGNAAFFDGGSYLAYSNAPANVLAALAGNFTLSLWVKTSQTSGSDGDPAFDDAGIVAADIPGQANDIIPMALTGGQIGYMTGGSFDDTINSTVDINSNQYHHVVVTRNQATGEKQIYIDGLLNQSDFASTNLLNNPVNIGIGSGIDASETDPSQLSNGQYYNGNLDDIQLYSRVLNVNEVGFLFNHPGQTVATIAPPPPFAGTVTLNFGIDRGQNPDFGDIFLLFPDLGVNPPPVTRALVSSPNGYFNGSTDSGSGSAVLSSLGQLLSECTNGQWTLTINQSNVAEQVFRFTVAIAGLTTNLLTQVAIHVPTNGAINVATNTPFQWSGGPAGFTSLSLLKQTISGGNQVSLNPAVSATNWPSPPGLDPGTNRFDVTYSLNNVTNVTFSVPVDGNTNLITNFVTQVNLSTGATSIFVVTGGATPVQLVNTHVSGTNLLVSFQSQTGFTNRVQYSTNLTSTNWLTYTNIPGDGNLKNLQVPLSIFGGSPKGFLRIHP
jgi:hypothetical protein